MTSMARRVASFLARCRAELADTGACNLESFIRSDAAQAMAAEALALIPLAYEKNTRRNAYFTKEDPSLPPDHPMRAFFPLRMSQLANDAIPKTAAIQRLYEWDPLTDYIRLVLGLEALYRIADPFLLPLPSKPSIAVLPFDNMSGDPEQEYFADGITEDIITELSRFRDLFVIARNSSFAYKGKSATVRNQSRANWASSTY